MRWSVGGARTTILRVGGGTDGWYLYQGVTQMVAHSGSLPTGTQAAAALGASEKGLYVSFALRENKHTGNQPFCDGRHKRLPIP